MKSVTLFRLLAIALSLWMGTAHALIILDTRTSTYELTGLSGDFSGAVAGYGIHVGGSADAAGATSFALQLKTEATGLSIAGNGVFSTNITGQTPAVANFDLTAAGAGPGQVNIGYSTAASDNFTRSWIVSGAEPGFSTLHFTGGGLGFVPFPLDPNDNVDRTAFFDVSIVLEGDWSSIGTGVGQLQFLGIDAAWTVDQFFQFDAGTNTTGFHAFNPAYTEQDFANSRTPNVDFVLRLAGVAPEPGTLAALLLGLPLLAWALRRR